MTEPETGATPEQIEEAAHRHYAHSLSLRSMPLDDDWDDRTPEYRQGWIDYMALNARHLVVRDHRIVPANRAIDDAGVAALGDALVLIDAWKAYDLRRHDPDEAWREFARWQLAFAAFTKDKDALIRRIVADATRTEEP